MVEINGIGVKATIGVNNCASRPTKNPTLAERARKLVNDTNAKMVASSVQEITDYVLRYPTKQSLIFDMKRHVGNAMSQECTQRAFNDVGEWLTKEGLTWKSQAQIDAAKFQPRGFNSQQDRSIYSQYTYHIEW